jgi:sugar lactone lactonase YvrE
MEIDMRSGKRMTANRFKDGKAMLILWTKPKTVEASWDEQQPAAGRQTRERRRENLMNALTMKRAVGLAGRYLAAASMVLGLAGVATSARAQGVPKYVVSTHSTLFKPFGGPAQGIAVNSRGDFFIDAGQDGTGTLIIDEFPADGSPAFPIFTVPSGYSYGTAGVTVDSNDNLYIAVFFGFGGADSGMYEFPFTNGKYPAAAAYSAHAAPSPCYGPVAATASTPAKPKDSSVCAIGSYVSAAYYYWQPIALTADYTGATYMYSNYDNTLNTNGSNPGFFYCDLLCDEQALGANALILVKGLPHPVKGFAGNPIAPTAGGAPGDIYWVDGYTVSYLIGSAAQGAAGTQVTNLLDSTYNNPTGVTFDRAGNLYVTDNTGIWETPLVSGQLVASSKFLVIPAGSGEQANAAVDTFGDVYYSPYYGDLEKGQLFSGTFPAASATVPGTAVGTTSPALNFTIAFSSSVTLGTVTALQGNAPATEFAVSAGTCTAGSTFAAGSTCSFSATFTPSVAGPRSGAVVITDSTGASTVTNLKGIGIGTAVTVDPGTAALIGSTGLQTPGGLSVDGAGNVFVADSAANAVYEYPIGGGAAVSIGSNLSVPTGVAADAAGNVFIVNQGTAATDASGVGEGSVVEVPNIGGTLTTASQSTVFAGLQLPTDIVIDSTGNFYVSNTAANEVLQFPSASQYGILSTSVSSVTSLGSTLNGPTGLALDAGDRLYIADTGNDQVVQLDEGNLTVVGEGLSKPTGVAVDASGSVIIADQGTGRLIRVPNEPLGLQSDDQVELDSPLQYPTSLRLDGSGNLYGSDSVEQEIYELQRTSGEINFLSYNVGSSSGSETVVLSSAGNLPLTLGSPLYAPVSAATGFVVGSSPYAKQPAAPDEGTVCATGSFPAGDNCVLSAVFSPTVAGPATYPLVLAAPASNTATPTVELVGTGVNLGAATATIAVTSPTGAITYGEQITVLFTITPTGSSIIPTGLVQFQFDGGNFQESSLGADGTVSYTFPSQNAGQHTIQAHYEGDANYPSLETAVLPITIIKASAIEILTISGDSSTPLSAAPTDTVGFSVSLQPSVKGLFTGTVSYTANGTVLGTVPVGDPTSTDPLYSAYYSSKTLPLGFYSVTATYSGNANYFPVTTTATELVISNPTFTVSATPSAVTATKATPGIVNLTVESYSNFQGGVDFSCAGLPANSYCIFRPGLVTLQDLPYQTSTIVPPVPAVMRIVVDESPVVVQGSTGTSIGWIGAVLAAGLLIYSRRKRSIRGLIGTGLLVLLSFGGIAALNGCGGNSTSYATPPGNYLVTVTAIATPLTNSGGVGVAANNVSVTFQVQLTVK